MAWQEHDDLQSPKRLQGIRGGMSLFVYHPRLQAKPSGLKWAFLLWVGLRIKDLPVTLSLGEPLRRQWNRRVTCCSTEDPIEVMQRKASWGSCFHAAPGVGPCGFLPEKRLQSAERNAPREVLILAVRPCWRPAG